MDITIIPPVIRLVIAIFTISFIAPVILWIIYKLINDDMARKLPRKRGN